MIKAVLFDIGNTLVTSLENYEVVRVLLKEKGYEKTLDEIKIAYSKTEEEYLENRGDKGFLEKGPDDFYVPWNSAVVKNLGIDDDDMKIGQYVYDRWFEVLHLAVYPDVEKTLDDLKARNIKLGLITNGYREEVDEVLPPLPISHDDFEVIVGCNTTGAEKPDPKPFLYALEKLGIGPEEAIYVGDSYKKDYLGAQGVGMKPVLLLRTGNPPNKDVNFIKTLYELFRLI